jgi:hypothetical protein
MQVVRIDHCFELGWIRGDPRSICTHHSYMIDWASWVGRILYPGQRGDQNHELNVAAEYPTPVEPASMEPKQILGLPRFLDLSTRTDHTSQNTA